MLETLLEKLGGNCNTIIAGRTGLELRMDCKDLSIPIPNDGGNVHTNIKIEEKKMHLMWHTKG